MAVSLAERRILGAALEAAKSPPTTDACLRPERSGVLAVGAPTLNGAK
jgi:hypothetical protein